jgi:Ca-activated chloride channel homolog
MLRRVFALLFGTVLLGAALGPASAQGDMPIFVPPPPGPWGQVTVDYHRVNVTIENQIASTNIDMQFTNYGEGLAEGQFIFPLPEGAAVDELIMYVNGQAIEARILPADEARNIYNEIVRQYRDPALLEYIGTSMIQANVFPIPGGESRRIEIRYQQVLAVDNGLFHYIYPLHAALNNQSIKQMSISVDVTSSDPISNVYSPSHNIAISRPG